jgi:FMN phosphatase YigB (HAD superfamily)
MPARTHTVLFDFDGTISLGSGPVLAYAAAASESLPAAHRAEFLYAVSSGLAAHPSGRIPGTDAIDGYDLVRILSVRYAIDPVMLSAAYLRSRAQLATEFAPVTAPAGLPSFLASVADRANLVVATNAPDTRFDAALAELGLAGLFDARYSSVGKPSGLDRVLDEWLPHGPLLSIGDVWANDLAPAHARGAATAFVGPVDHALADDLPAEPTFRADTLPELYPAILAWLDDDDSSVPHTSSVPHDSRRIRTATTER